MKKVRISPLFVCLLCVSVYFGWGQTVGAAILAALCHEVGHVAAIFLFGGRIISVTFAVSGGEIRTEPMTYGQESLCAAMGPLVNLILFCTCSRLFPIFGFSNLVLLLFNLFPVYPLDGGRILRAVLLLHFAEERVRKIIHIVSLVFTGVLMVGAVCLSIYMRWGLWPMLLAASILWKTGTAADREGY